VGDRSRSGERKRGRLRSFPKKGSHVLTLADRHELTISFKNPYYVINRALPNLTSGLHNEDLKDF